MLHLSEIQWRMHNSNTLSRMIDRASGIELAVFSIAAFFAALFHRPLTTLKWVAICTGLMLGIILIGWIAGGFSLSPYSSFR